MNSKFDHVLLGFIGGAVAMILLFLVADNSSEMRAELTILKKHQVVCPVCEGSGVMPVPEVKADE